MAVNTVIATNVMAMNTDRYLGIAKKRQSFHGNRLSSGTKLNSASDDAAGVAISQKMKAQIRCLDAAEKNTQDTISFLNVVEGSLSEITEIAQRCRELSIQAANDTNTADDRSKIVAEIYEITREIEGILERTEFNGVKVFSQDLQRNFQIGANSSQKFDFGLQAMSFEELMTVKDEGLYQSVKALFNETVKTAIETALAQDPYTIGNSFTIKSNSSGLSSVTVSLCNFKSFIDPIFDAINNLDTEGLNLVTELKDEMKDAINTFIQGMREASSDLLSEKYADRGHAISDSTRQNVANATAVGSAFNPGDDVVAWYLESDEVRVSAVQMIDAIESQDKVVILACADGTGFLDKDDPNSFFGQLEALLDSYVEKFDNEDIYEYDLMYELEACLSGERNISSNKFSDTYIPIFDNIISIVSETRSKVGSCINRLEYVSDSLKISSENLSSANSNIEDADMAAETMGLTASNIIVQASTTLLAQANSSKDSVISLLQ